jgi:hypothetical protein
MKVRKMDYIDYGMEVLKVENPLHYQNHLNFKPFISVAERKIN